MKSFAVFIIMFYASDANSQQIDVPEIKSLDGVNTQTIYKERSGFIPKGKLAFEKEDDGDNGVYKIPSKGKFLGTTEKGDGVYAMTPDNMPCLVPAKTFKSNMPVALENKPLKFLESPSNR